MLLYSGPGPDDRSQRILAHSAGCFSENAENLLPIAHLLWGIQVTPQKQSLVSDILALPMSGV